MGCRGLSLHQRQHVASLNLNTVYMDVVLVAWTLSLLLPDSYHPFCHTQIA
eukprot:COSAG02_NODE_1994_length_10160_cov_84.117483_12_plen_51_part_00